MTGNPSFSIDLLALKLAVAVIKPSSLHDIVIEYDAIKSLARIVLSCDSAKAIGTHVVMSIVTVNISAKYFLI